MSTEYIDTLIHAIKGINSKFCTLSGRTEIINERSFAYELYRVWQNEIEEENPELIVNAEVTKMMDEEFKSTGFELFGDDLNRFYPDMVLHRSQSDCNWQELICEIKIFNKLSKESLLKDIKKLVAYTTPGCILYGKFNQAVFILVNGTKKMLMDKFEMNEIERYKKSPITCLFVNIQDLDNVESCSLKELFDCN